MTIQLPQSLEKQLQEYAKQNKKSVNEVASKIIANFFKGDVFADLAKWDKLSDEALANFEKE
jgi:hypothetical protein